MESFNQLLNHYIQRLGLSDSELARTIGVSRQTIFRWREGSTARPRHREDVLAIAGKLRLSPEERDKLLLAAGFRPESAAQSPDITVETLGVLDETDIGGEEQASTTPGENPKSRHRHASEIQNPKLIMAIVGVVLIIGGGIWWFNWGPIDNGNPGTPTVSIISQSSREITPAVEGETLILVTHFANYASSQIGYNVAGRLAEALQREVDNTHLENIRIAIWPGEIDDRNLALQTGREFSATLVIYGEYDVGRVVVEMAHPNNQNIFVDPALQRQVADLQDLSATINTDLPQQVRSLALMALGQIYLRGSETERARLLLAQARDNLRNDTTVDERTWGLANFYLGIAYQHSDPPDLDEAIIAYTEAIDAWPTMISSRLNRGAAYEARKASGDFELALADVEAVLDIRPDWALGYNNRASIRLNIGGDENLALALADLDKSLELNPDLPEVYINRAYIYVRQGRPMAEIEPTLEKALALRPGYGTALNTLCWGYALEEQSEVALPYCEQAIEADPKPIYRDSRGLAYALLEDYPAAIDDFQAYVAWLEEQPEDGWQEVLTRRQAWLAELENGENPFTPEVLAELRSEFGQ